MTKQLQFYDEIAPISAERHRHWSVEKQPDYAYTSRSNAVPLTAAEFAAAAQEYTIVFLGGEAAPTPVVLLGLSPEENLYLEDGHRWKARYIPAFIRRYPFVFAQSDGGHTYTLCIDESFEGCNQEGRGEPLFDVSGVGSGYLNAMMQFLTSYQQQIAATTAVSNRLKELDLLEEMTARFELPSGEKAQVNGFMAVDRSKLTQLPAETLAELASNGALELIYAHLLSMRNFSELLELRTRQHNEDTAD